MGKTLSAPIAFTVIGPPAPIWSGTPFPSFVASVASQYVVTSFVQSYSASTDVITLAPSSVALPGWLTFNGTAFSANGSQVDANDFGGVVLRVTRNGSSFTDSSVFGVQVTPGNPAGAVYFELDDAPNNGPTWEFI